MKSGVSGSLRRRVMREGGYRCAWCGLAGGELRYKGPFARTASFLFPTEVEGVSLSVDHVIPRALGGTSERSNLRVLCTSCNTIKGSTTGDERKSRAVHG